MTEVVGWRIYALNSDGTLKPPFVASLLPDQYEPGRDDWRPGENTARCVFGEHPAPHLDCRCGLRIVHSRFELIEQTATDYLPNTSRTVLESSGVVARVVGRGRSLPGTDMPLDDPLTTIRVERVELVEVFLARGLMTHAPAVRRRYNVPVNLAGDWWPRAVTAAPVDAVPPGPERFLATLAEQGFGTADVGAAGAQGWLACGQQMAKALEDGVSAEQVLRAAFDSNHAPTLKQAEGLVLAVLRNFASDLDPNRGWGDIKPLTGNEVLLRNIVCAALGQR